MKNLVYMSLLTMFVLSAEDNDDDDEVGLDETFETKAPYNKLIMPGE